MDLRRDGYRPAAWLVYARRCVRLSRDHALTRQQTLRSLGLTSLVGFLALLTGAVALALTGDVELARAFLLSTGVTLVAGLTWIAAHLCLLVDETGLPRRRLNAANHLTLIRLVMIPAFLVLLGHGRSGLALAAFAIGALTDVADGLVARLAHERTPLGRVFDPVVDILFNLALFSGLYARGFLPAWVLALVICRYALLLVGALGLYVLRGPLEIKPTALGKTTGVITTLLLAALTAGVLSLPPALAPRLTPVLVLGIAFFEAITIPQVLLIGWLNFQRIGVPAVSPRLTLVKPARRSG